MKYNLGICHKPDAHTSTHLHKKKTVWKERQTGEEEKLPPSPLFGLVHFKLAGQFSLVVLFVN